MDAPRWIRNLLGSGRTGGYDAVASLDLDVLEASDAASKLLVQIDMSRLAQRNKERRVAAHNVFGDLHVEAGELTWRPQRVERTCGVPDIRLARQDLRTIERRDGAVVAVLRDGTNVAFIVPTQTATGRKRSALRSRAKPQEPPLIS